MAKKASHRKKDSLVERHKSASRKLKTSLTRRRWRTVKAKPVYRLTNLQKAQLQAVRKQRKKDLNEALSNARGRIWDDAKQLREQFGTHTEQYYYEQILQTGRLAKTRRKVSRWNAYLHAEVKRINEGLEPGQRRKATQLMGEISHRWNMMSLDEQKTITEPLISEVEEIREMKKLSTHNVPIEAFGDASQSLMQLEKEIHSLHARTSTEVILIAVRSNLDAYLRPFTISTSQRGEDFIRMATNGELSALAMQYEAYCVAGVKGVVNNYVQDLLEIKKKTAAVITQKLRESAQTKISRMIYTNFDDAITAKHGIVIEGWPPGIKFCSPSDLKSRNEVKVLYHAWESGTAKFRLLSTAEWKRWSEDRFSTLSNPMVAQEPMDGDAGGAPALSLPSNRAETDIAPQTTGGAASGSDQNPVPDGNPVPEQPSSPSSDSTSSVDKRPAIDCPPDAPQSKRQGLAVLNNFVNTMSVTSADGVAIVTERRQRKPRKDKGTKRGPNKRSATNAAA